MTTTIPLHLTAGSFANAGNAVVRKLLHYSSNGLLETQWWLFAAVFLLAAPWTLSLNEPSGSTCA